ncbi:TPA: Rha family transcriptional regulator [Pseudomonas aeruginosa]|nr:Rha family transcriptional regulator [Pseudomonas aeruginosa]
MTDLTPIGGQAATMTSREIADLVGSRHDNVRVTIERLAERGVIALPAMQEKPTAGRPTQEYVFTGDQGKRDSIIVVAQLCPEFTARLVDRWQELEQQASRSLTQAEQMLAHAQIQVQLERRQQQIEQQQAQQQVAIERVEQRVEDLSESRVWDHCPQNCMPITRIREVIHDRYGLSATVVDAVVRQMPNSPKPWGMVRNGHENAQGSQYAVWAISDITAVFKRFISECERVTETQATHPYFPGRFRLPPKVNV